MIATLLKAGRNEKTFGPDWALDRAWIGGTPFWLAARFAEVDMMRVVAARGADARLAANDGTTPFVVAAQAENVPSRRNLMQKLDRRYTKQTTMNLGMAFLTDPRGDVDRADGGL
jgi:hypothetical protein